MGGHDQTEVRVAELVHLHFDFVWRLLRRLGAIDSEDATQQVFMVAWKKLDDIEAGKERAFLVGIAVKVAADHRRARRRRPESSEEAPDAATSEADPHELVSQRQARALLDRILEALTAELRQAWVLCEVEQLTMREIAEVLDIPSGTVASRLRRAREAFHQELERVWPSSAREEDP